MGFKRKTKTKRRTRDIDQVHADLKSAKHLHQYKITKATEDLPGLGQWYCIDCAKWFESEHNFQDHRRGKAHKRRVRALQKEPYTQKEADAAAGMSTDIGEIKPDTTSNKYSETHLVAESMEADC